MAQPPQAGGFGLADHPDCRSEVMGVGWPADGKTLDRGVADHQETRMSLSPDPAIASIRTVALVGQAGAGKTLLAEALLSASGAIASAGSLERGSTVSDHDPLERRAGHSLNTSLLHLERGDTRIQLIDTPGAPDFIGQSMAALEAVETAIVVVDAVSGIGPMSSRMMDWAGQRGLARIVVVNRIDAQGVDLEALLQAVQAQFGRECLPLNLPARSGQEVVDCYFNPVAPRGHEPDFLSVESAHRALVEQVVEVDAAFVERYLNEGDVDPAELHAPLEQALREAHLLPVCFVSARTGAGVEALLDVIDRLMPNPTEGNPPRFLKGEGPGAQAVEALPDPERHVIAHVFKLMQDPFLGRVGVFRIHQGSVTRDSQLFVGDGRRPFKVGHLLRLQGRNVTEISRGVPGDLCAVAKVEDIHFDAVLHDAAEDDHLHLQLLPFPIPVHGMAIEPQRRGDEQRLWDLLQRLVDEDPCLKLEHVAPTRETVVYGLSELHLRTLIDRLTVVHHIEVLARPPRIAYRETISQPAEGHHRHKKQTGGAGQFGEVFLHIEPLARSAGAGRGFEFVDAVKGGTIPGHFMPAVEKGVRQAFDEGVLAGYPVMDVRVTVHDGKHHSVDSKEIAFVTAGRRAFIEAFRQAGPTVLEPFVDIEVQVPEACIGDVTGDLAARRGQVAGTRDLGSGEFCVLGQAPLAELAGYQSRLNSLSAGAGRYTMSFSHYAAAPASVQAGLVAAARPEQGEL